MALNQEQHIQPNLYEEEDSQDQDDEIDDDPDSDSHSNSFGTPITTPITTTTTTTTIIPITQTPIPPTIAVLAQPIQEKKPSSFDDSRKLFQRLWTDEDEIGLLRGFLEHNTQPRPHNASSSYHIDNAMFYDQIKTRLQLDFSKNQLIDKLRRLKKKYRNAISRITSGKDFNFKTPHDHTTFEISHQIWGATTTATAAPPPPPPASAVPIAVDKAKVEQDVEINNTVTTTTTTDNKVVGDSRKRPRQTLEEGNFTNSPNVVNKQENTASVIEEAIKSCVSPFIKELVCCATNGYCNLGFGMSQFPLSLGGKNVKNGEVVDEKWRNQQILELEVYSKRMELVQEQIKLALEELKSNSS